MISTQKTSPATISLPNENRTGNQLHAIYKRMQVLWETHHDGKSKNPTFETFIHAHIPREIERLNNHPGFPAIIAIDPKGMPVFEWIEEHATLPFLPVGTEEILYMKPEIVKMICEKNPRAAFENTDEMNLVFSHFKAFLSAGVPRNTYINHCQTHATWMSYILFHFFKIECKELYIIPKGKGKLTPCQDLFPADITPGWHFHVAVQMECQNGPCRETYILDPTLESPVLLSRWITGLKSPTGIHISNSMYRTRWRDPNILSRISFAKQVLFNLCDRYNPK